MAATPPFLAFDATTKLPRPEVLTALRKALGFEQKLATFGDSMTALTQGGYAPYGSLVSDYLGLSLFNPSTPGERTSDISFRQGGFAVKFTVPGGAIPIDTTEFPITLAESYTTGFSPAATTKGNIGTFLNVSGLGIPLNVYHVNNAWTAARVTAASGSNPQPVAVPSSGLVIRDIASSAWRDAIQVYMGGFNGGDQVKDVNMMSAYLAIPGRFVVLGMSTGQSGADPTPYKAANAALASAFPSQYFDMASYVIANGLADEGIVATSQDATDIAAGIVPTSLRRATNDPHYNAAGQRVIARRLAELLIERGLVLASSSQKIPARAAGITNLILSLPTSTSVASIAANSALQASDTISVRLIDMTIPSVTASSGSYRALASRWQSGSGNWQFLLAADGTLFMQDANGSLGFSGAPIAPASGVISLRLDINRSAGTAAFYTSTNSGSTWTQYGNAGTGRSTTNALSGNSVALLRAGSTGSYPAVEGARLKRLTILNGSTTVVDHDFTVSDTEGWTYSGGAVIVGA